MFEIREEYSFLQYIEEIIAHIKKAEFNLRIKSTNQKNSFKGNKKININTFV